MIDYELINQVLILARALEVISLVAGFAAIAHFFQLGVNQIFNAFRRKPVDKSNNK